MNRMQQELTTAEFRDAIRKDIRERGIDRVMLASLRKQVLESFSPYFVRSALDKSSIKNGNNELEETAIHSMVMDFLQGERMNQTLSVYSAESGIPTKYKKLNREEYLEVFGIQQNSHCFQHMVALNRAKNILNGSCQHDVVDNRPCILHNLIRHTKDGIISLSKRESKSTQTVSKDVRENARNHLELQLERLKCKYEIKLEAEFMKPIYNFKEKIEFCQKECEERYKKEAQQDLKIFKENSLMEIKLKEVAKYKSAIDKMRSELKFDYDLQLQKAKEDFETRIQSILSKQREYEKEILDKKQKVMVDLDTVKMRKAEVEKHLHEQNQNLQDEKERVSNLSKIVESKHKDLEVRERELQVRLSAVREEAAQAKQLEKSQKNELKLQEDKKRLIEKNLQNIAKFKKLSMEKEHIICYLRIQLECMKRNLENQKNAKCVKCECSHNDNSDINKTSSQNDADKTSIFALEIKSREEGLRIKDEKMIEQNNNFQKSFSILRKEVTSLTEQLDSANHKSVRAQLELETTKDEIVELRKLLDASQGALQSIKLSHEYGVEPNLKTI